ncbi:hypothetical protein DL96DRAFT_1706383 [Flagelloscypha sp. PMI_526]|nr:hypothetical protein DL96DRAFT_1706383 [Flagelloscypha sp. PMI_526]
MGDQWNFQYNPLYSGYYPAQQTNEDPYTSGHPQDPITVDENTLVAPRPPLFVDPHLNGPRTSGGSHPEIYPDSHNALVNTGGNIGYPELTRSNGPFPSGATHQNPPISSPLDLSSSPDNMGTEKRCANCNTTKTPEWRRERNSHRVLCNACGIYLRTKGEHRPASFNSVERSDPVEPYFGPRCSHCGITHTPTWRRDPDNNLLCNACGMYLRTNGRMRPLNSTSLRSGGRSRGGRPHEGGGNGFARGGFQSQ